MNLHYQRHKLLIADLSEWLHCFHIWSLLSSFQKNAGFDTERFAVGVVKGEDGRADKFNNQLHAGKKENDKQLNRVSVISVKKSSSRCVLHI